MKPPYTVRWWALNPQGKVYSREARHSSIEAAGNELEDLRRREGVFRVAIVYEHSQPPLALKVWFRDRDGRENISEQVSFTGYPSVERSLSSACSDDQAAAPAGESGGSR